MVGVTGCVEVASGETGGVGVECCALSLQSVHGAWLAEAVAAADTRCKVAFSTAALCSAAGVSEGTVTVGVARGESGAGVLGRDEVGETGSRSVTTRMVKRGAATSGEGSGEAVIDALGSV